MTTTQGQISLVRGEDRVVPFVFRKKSGAPLDLTDCTAIVATFKTSSNETASVTLAAGAIEIVTPAGSGLVNVTLSSAFTTALQDGERLDFQVDLTIAGKKFRFKFEEALNVEESIV